MNASSITFSNSFFSSSRPSRNKLAPPLSYPRVQRPSAARPRTDGRPRHAARVWHPTLEAQLETGWTMRVRVARTQRSDPKVVSMPLKLAWLKMLKNSARNCKFTDSVMRLFLKKDMSHL